MAWALDLKNLHDEALTRWSAGETGDAESEKDLESLIIAQHYCNFCLWNFEDEARRRDVDDSYIAGVKRDIDAWNQKRNDRIERIDERILSDLEKRINPDADLHSETAGMMIDRLSILALKIFHMGRNASREDDPVLAAECASKLEVLERQRGDLLFCLERLLEDCHSGRRRYKLYRQFKAYNDERLNPALRPREDEVAER